MNPEIEAGSLIASAITNALTTRAAEGPRPDNVTDALFAISSALSDIAEGLHRVAKAIEEQRGENSR